MNQMSLRICWGLVFLERRQKAALRVRMSLSKLSLMIMMQSMDKTTCWTRWLMTSRNFPWIPLKRVSRSECWFKPLFEQTVEVLLCCLALLQDIKYRHKILMPYRFHPFLLSRLRSSEWILRTGFYVVVIDVKQICETEVTPLDLQFSGLSGDGWLLFYSSCCCSSFHRSLAAQSMYVSLGIRIYFLRGSEVVAVFKQLSYEQLKDLVHLKRKLH